VNEEQMTPEQREAVDDLARSQSGESPAATASADEQATQPATPQQTAARPESEVGVQPRQALREEQQTARNPVPERPTDDGDAERTPVMADDAAAEYRARWQETQANFVDDPRSAVTAADALVAEVMKRVAEEFANERNGLERQWNEGGEASTEDLRLAFQRYRSFFSRLLSL